MHTTKTMDTKDIQQQTRKRRRNSEERRLSKKLKMVDLEDIAREVLKRKGTPDGGRSPKRQKLYGPPVHTRSFLVQTKLAWKLGNKRKSVTALLAFDRGATGPVLASPF